MTAADLFRDLHQEGCFVLPNPWDAGSARYLQHLGFAAVATTSSGMAWSMGRPDGGVGVDAVLDHVRSIVDAVSIPVNADFEHGYADDVAGLTDNVRRCAETGVAGLSIEDSTGRPDEPLFERDDAVRRVEAARAAIDASGTGVVLTARAECFLWGRPDPLAESIARLRTYVEAGADCVYAPGVRDPDEARQLIEAVAPTPVNLLALSGLGDTVEDLAALGARRLSVGGGLARVAWKAFSQQAAALHDGDLGYLSNAIAGAELNGLFGGGTRRSSDGVG
jgi:2-methylisocitrate lyase-like PEP mutase family enzyme